jgi:hypothetical protein
MSLIFLAHQSGRIHPAAGVVHDQVEAEGKVGPFDAAILVEEINGGAPGPIADLRRGSENVVVYDAIEADPVGTSLELVRLGLGLHRLKSPKTGCPVAVSA